MTVEALIKKNIAGNDMISARQANVLLTHWGVTGYSGELAAIGKLDALLAKYRKAKDIADVTATETLLRGYGVRHFASGGLVMDRGGYLAPGWNPPVYNGTGRPEAVIPGGGGGGSRMTADGQALAARLDALAVRLDRLNQTAAAIPQSTGRHVGAAVNGGSSAAVFRSRYPTRGA